MKKKHDNKKPIKQLKIDFDGNANNIVENNQQLTDAKVISIDFRSHIYRSILKRKMQ